MAPLFVRSVAAARRDTPAREPLTADALAHALGGRKAGAGWMARCPAHDDRAPSLSIGRARDGTVLVRCHAGCDQARVIAALRARGVWSATGARTFGRARSRTVARRPDADAANRARARRAAALAIWETAGPAHGTPVETYLASRGLTLPPAGALRFHAGLKHPAGGLWPAMVALVTRGHDGAPLAIHRTFLARDGGGKAPVSPQKPQKMMLGPCAGGAVRLADPGGVLMVGEGIETCLAAMRASGHAAWAALSTAGLRTLELPNEIRDVIVLADGDVAGASAANDCALRWKREGRRVRIATPPPGLDFNDMLMAREEPPSGS